ncbi:hypothetical protein [Trinickia mobilis]|uniref:hypothetical protein n=1 Tax=Trinickia mobilis TaxID=2816356 RepID=UPI001A8CFF05|nr:hypothetical protein [Trinickia mobilis]
MEKWIVIGSIWAMSVACLVLFVRGASPAHSRALAMARSRAERRRKAALEKQPQSSAEPKGT